MKGYLGEKEVDLYETKYKDYKPQDWAMLWIYTRSQYDGSHHKMRCLDEVMQILCNTKVILKIASWDSGETEERFILGEPSQEYLNFVEEYQEDGEYEWDNGFN